MATPKNICACCSIHCFVFYHFATYAVDGRAVHGDRPSLNILIYHIFKKLIIVNVIIYIVFIRSNVRSVWIVYISIPIYKVWTTSAHFFGLIQL